MVAPEKNVFQAVLHQPGAQPLPYQQVLGGWASWPLVFSSQFTLLQSVNHVWDPELPLALREKPAALAKGWCPCSRSGGYWPWPEVWVEGVEKSAIKSQSEAESAWKGYWAQTQLRKTRSQVISAENVSIGRLHGPSGPKSQRRSQGPTWALPASIYQTSP